MKHYFVILFVLFAGSDDYQLFADSFPHLYRIDFSSILDSPIAKIEWGEPLWYLAD